MEKVLIIEDDEVFSGGLVRALSRRGFTCAVAANSQDAQKITQSIQPHYILLDLKLGNENGEDLIAPLRDSSPHSRIIILTGYGSIPSAVKAIQNGAYTYLTKPMAIDELLKAFKEQTPNKNSTDLEALTQDHIVTVLKDHHGNISQAAKALGLHRRTLQRKLKKILPSE